MAKGKKSFVLYADYIEIVEELTDEEAGLLFKTIMRYVNDLDPEIPKDIRLAFIPIKQDLKRDLKKYEEKCLKNKENISKRWNKTENNPIQEDTNEYERINSYSDNDNVNDNDIKINDKLINHVCTCEEEEKLEFSKDSQKLPLKQEIENLGLSYIEYQKLHKWVKQHYKSKELDIAEAITLSELLYILDKKYEPADVLKAWLYSWDKSKESNNRVAYITSILEKNIKRISDIKF